MADTYTVSISDSAWADISQGNASGFFTNRADNVALYRQAASAPLASETDGHRLNPAMDAVNFTVVAPDRVYARSLSGPGQIMVTP